MMNSPEFAILTENPYVAGEYLEGRACTEQEAIEQAVKLKKASPSLRVEIFKSIGVVEIEHFARVSLGNKNAGLTKVVEVRG